MEKSKISNYDKLCEKWRLEFLNMDIQQLMKKLPELKKEGDSLFITHFGRKYGIRIADGIIYPAEDDNPVENPEKMNIYNLFWYSKETAFFRNNWVPFRNVKGAGPFAPAFEKTVLKPFARTFEGKTEAFCRAAEKIGGQPVKQSDAGYVLKAFDCIPMQFLFWDGDDEFPAQSNILFDYSVTDYIHVESTVALAVEGFTRLAQAAGIEKKGQTFGM